MNKEQEDWKSNLSEWKALGGLTDQEVLDKIITPLQKENASLQNQNVELLKQAMLSPIETERIFQERQMKDIFPEYPDGAFKFQYLTGLIMLAKESLNYQKQRNELQEDLCKKRVDEEANIWKGIVETLQKENASLQNQVQVVLMEDSKLCDKIYSLEQENESLSKALAEYKMQDKLNEMM